MHNERYYQQARAAFELRRYDRAMEIALDGLEQDPEDPNLFLLISQVELSRGHYHAAREAAREALRIAPEDASPYCALGWAILSDADYPDKKVTQDESQRFDMMIKEARELAQTALSVDPEAHRVLLLMTEIEFLLDNPQAALEVAEKGMQLAPGSIYFRHDLIRAHRALGQPEAALEYCWGCLELSPEDPVALFQKAELELERRNYERASRDAREAIRLDPENDRYRQVYWDAIKSRNWVFRPLVAWQFFARRLARLPDGIKGVANFGGPALAGLAGVGLKIAYGWESAPLIMVLLVAMLALMFVSERPGMALADAWMFVTDKQFRMSVDRKQLLIELGVICLVFAFCVSLVFAALENYTPFFTTLASLFFIAPALAIVDASRWFGKAVQIVNVILFITLLVFGTHLLLNSQNNSSERLYSVYCFMGFAFLAIAGPSLYFHYKSESQNKHRGGLK